MKMVVAVIHSRDETRLTEELLRSDIRFTKIGSTGGFLREGNTTLLLGVEDAQVEFLLNVIAGDCHERERYIALPSGNLVGTNAPGLTGVKTVVGGGVAFVMDIAQFVKF
jgi:uncharacterized protein YaaQ